ncbi:hypothetical protein DMUE_2955 [Dictyocoela muelleri]|nr:hypothetical protein DMUE_2955 [Dictyocoela muelleri]
MKSEIKKITKRCVKYQLNKFKKNTEPNDLGKITAVRQFLFFSSDILGPIKTQHFLTQTDREYFYILNITDIYSKFTSLFFIEGFKSSNIIPCFADWVNNYPTP